MAGDTFLQLLKEVEKIDGERERQQRGKKTQKEVISEINQAG